MNSCQYENLLPDYCSGDLSRAEQASVKNHLDTCDSCRKLVEELTEVQALLAQRSRPKPTAELLKEYRSMLSAQFKPAAPNKRNAVETLRHLISGKTISWRVVQVACLLLVGLLLGRLIYNPSKSERVSIEQRPVQHSEELRFISDFLVESEMLLLEIVNRDLAKLDQYPDDFVLDSNTAQQLLMQTFVLHQHALQLQINGLPELLTQMELILYELANTETREDRTQLTQELKKVITSNRLLDVSRELRGRIKTKQRRESETTIL